MGQPRILLVEDDAAGRELAVYNLEKAGYAVDAAASGEDGLARFEPGAHELVITDIRMPGISGLQLLDRIRELAPDTPVLVITAYGNVEVAVDAMRRGAFDFIGKPFNREHLLLVVRRALENRRLAAEVRDLRIKAGGVEREIIGDAPAFSAVLDLADRVAGSDATVLITGESGTGKELLARRIHVRSPRAAASFVPVNSGAVPAELLESELFGHTKGAFTGAIRERVGRFRQADGGTLFLDEIGDLPLALQAKLLRVLQERTVEVVGADTARPVDVRVVAATNRDLAQDVAAGRFREDLLYRLNVIELQLPPLRDRRADIDRLVAYFVERFAGGRELAVPPALAERLRAWRWPGNVRELENVVQRLVALCDGAELSADDLPQSFGREPAASGDLLGEWPELPADGLSLIDLEKRVIERVLELKEGNVTQAAAYLRVPRHVLAYRMEKYGIPRKR